MANEFTAVIEHDGEQFLAYRQEIPGANGQGRTKEEALESLSEAIALILDDRREDGMRGLPAAWDPRLTGSPNQHGASWSNVAWCDLERRLTGRFNGPAAQAAERRR
jgi:predicted RNase H-like HicB family nuclease